MAMSHYSEQLQIIWAEPSPGHDGFPKLAIAHAQGFGRRGVVSWVNIERLLICCTGIRRTDTANEELYVERSCGNSSSGCNSQHTPASEHGHGKHSYFDLSSPTALEQIHIAAGAALG